MLPVFKVSLDIPAYLSASTETIFPEMLKPEVRRMIQVIMIIVIQQHKLRFVHTS